MQQITLFESTILLFFKQDSNLDPLPAELSCDKATTATKTRIRRKSFGSIFNRERILDTAAAESKDWVKYGFLYESGDCFTDLEELGTF